jgi:hypothetical protein
VEVAGFSIEAHAIPVEDTISGIGVLLNFVDEKSGANGVETSGGDEDGLANFWTDGVDLLLDRAIEEGLFEGFARGSFIESDVKFGLGVAVGDVPHFGLGIAAKIICDCLRRVDLDGEVVASVEDLDKEGKAVAGQAFAEDLFAVPAPKVVEGFSGKFSLRYEGLFAFAVGNLPRFSVGLIVGEGSVVVGFKRAATPNAGHVNGRKDDWFHHRRSWRRDETLASQQLEGT